MVAVCVALLTADYLISLRRVPRDPKVVQSNAEQKRVTEFKLARKKRDNALAWLLIAAASAFLYSWGERSMQTRAASRSEPPKRRLQAKLPASQTQPAAIDLEFVDRAVTSLGRGKESAIPLLQAIQAHYHYLPDEALRRVCELTEITPAEIAGTSSFYARFRRSPVGAHVVRVCHGTACHVAGARQITDELRRYLAIPEGADTDPARRFTIDEVACLGCCSLAPVLMVDGHPAGKLTPTTACDALQEFA